jgi:uncharacterized protein YjbI with pentapeptide repeats
MNDACLLNAVNCHTRLLGNLNARLQQLENGNIPSIIDQKGMNGEVAFWDANQKLTVDNTFYYDNSTNTLYVENIYVDQTIQAQQINTTNLEIFDTLIVNKMTGPDGNVSVIGNLVMDCNTTIYTNHITSNPDCGPNLVIDAPDVIFPTQTNIYVSSIYPSSPSGFIFIGGNVLIPNVTVANVTVIDIAESNVANIHDLYVENVHPYPGTNGNIRIDGNLILDCNNVLAIHKLEPNPACGPNLVFSNGNLIIDSASNLIVNTIYAPNNDTIVFKSNVYVSNIGINYANITQAFIMNANITLANITSANITNSNITNANIVNIGSANNGGNVNVKANLVFDCSANLMVNHIQPNPACDGNITLARGNLVVPVGTCLFVDNVYSATTDTIYFRNNVSIPNLTIGNVTIGNITANRGNITDLYIQNLDSINNSYINANTNIYMDCDSSLFLSTIRNNPNCGGNVSIVASNIVIPSSSGNFFVPNVFSSNADSIIYFRDTVYVSNIYGPQAYFTNANLTVANITQTFITNANIINSNITGANIINSNITNANIVNLGSVNNSGNVNIYANLVFDCNANLMVNHIQPNPACDGNITLARGNLVIPTGAHLNVDNIYSATSDTIYFGNNVSISNLSVQVANVTQVFITNANIINSNITSANITNSNITNANIVNLGSANNGGNVRIAANLVFDCFANLMVNHIQPNPACDGNITLASGNVVIPNGTRLNVDNIYSATSDTIYFDNNVSMSNVSISDVSISNIFITQANVLYANITNANLVNLGSANNGGNVNVKTNMVFDCFANLMVNHIQPNPVCDGNLTLQNGNLVIPTGTQLNVDNIYSATSDTIYFGNNVSMSNVSIGDISISNTFITQANVLYANITNSNIVNLGSANNGGNVNILANLVFDCTSNLMVNHIQPNPVCDGNLTMQNGNLVIPNGTRLYVDNIYSATSDTIYFDNNVSMSNVSIGDVSIGNIFITQANITYANITNANIVNLGSANNGGNVNILANLVFDCFANLMVNHIQPNPACDGNITLQNGNIVIPNGTQLNVDNIYSATSDTIYFDNNVSISNVSVQVANEIQAFITNANIMMANITSANIVNSNITNANLVNLGSVDNSGNVNVYTNLVFDCISNLMVNHIQPNPACNGNITLQNGNLVIPTGTQLNVDNIYSATSDTIYFGNNVSMSNVTITDVSISNIFITQANITYANITNANLVNLGAANNSGNINVKTNLVFDCFANLIVNHIQPNPTCDGNITLERGNLVLPASTNFFVSNVFSSNVNGIRFNSNVTITSNTTTSNLKVTQYGNIASLIAPELYVTEIYPHTTGNGNVTSIGNFRMDCGTILYVNKIENNPICGPNVLIQANNVVVPSTATFYVSNITSSNTNLVNISANLIVSNINTNGTANINTLLVNNMYAPDGNALFMKNNVYLDCNSSIYMNFIQSNPYCEDSNMTIQAPNIVLPSSVNLFVSNLFSSNVNSVIYLGANLVASNIMTEGVANINTLLLNNLYAQDSNALFMKNNLYMDCNSSLYVNNIDANPYCGSNITIKASNVIIPNTSDFYVYNVNSSDPSSNIYFQSSNVIISNTSDFFVYNIYSSDPIGNVNFKSPNVVVSNTSDFFVRTVYSSNIDGNIYFCAPNVIVPNTSDLFIYNVYSSNTDGNIYFQAPNIIISNTSTFFVSNFTSSDISSNSIQFTNTTNVYMESNLILSGSLVLLSNVQIQSILPQQQTVMSTAKIPYGGSGIPSSIKPMITNIPGYTIQGNTSSSSFDLNTLYPDILLYSGGVYDGTYVYFATQQMDTGETTDLRLVRARFQHLQSFVEGNPIVSTADIFESVVIPGYAANTTLTGGFFDGVRYVNFVGASVTMTASNVGFVSYDISKPFLNASSFTLQAPGAINSGTFQAADMIEGCIYDGSAVYLLPARNTGNVYKCRYDYSNINNLFTTGAASRLNMYDSLYWNSASNLNVSGAFNNGYFTGGAYDGRYIYFPPKTANVLMRYDTSATTSVDGFQTIPVRSMIPNPTADPQYESVSYDGRYVYYIPRRNSTNQTTSSILLRYDTTQDFKQTYAYSNIDMSTIQLAGNTSFVGFKGGIFDGKYLNLLPSSNSTLATTASWILQYDTTKSFFDIRANVSYRSLNLRASDNELYGFDGGVWDMKYIYLPAHQGSNLVVLPTYAGSATDCNRPLADTYVAQTTASSSNIEILRYTNSALTGAPTSNACYEISLISSATDATANYLGYRTNYFVCPGNLADGTEIIPPISEVGVYVTNVAFKPNVYLQRTNRSYQIISDGTSYSQSVAYTHKVSKALLNPPTGY